jgi:cyanophycinase-like exopeptidase
VESALSTVGGGVDDETVHVVADDRDVGVVGRGVVVSFVAFDGRACS